MKKYIFRNFLGNRSLISIAENIEQAEADLFDKESTREYFFRNGLQLASITKLEYCTQIF